MTDITDKIGGIIYYDAGCSFCSGWAGALEHLLARWDFSLAPLATASDEMRVDFFDGRRYGGADAIVALVSYVWWLRPFALLAKLSPAALIGRRAEALDIEPLRSAGRRKLASTADTVLHRSTPKVRSFRTDFSRR